MQLFRNGLFPSSLDQPGSAFTFAVLDNFGIDAMECKTAVQSFYRKLCRMTNNAFPKNVPVHDLSNILTGSMLICLQGPIQGAYAGLPSMA